MTRNADELRFSKETDTGTTNFIWDNQNIVQEVDDLNSVEAEYTLNPQPYGNLVSQRREDESTFYNYDALGSTQSLTDEMGTVSNEYNYSAFGKITSQTGSTENPFTWIGELGYYQNPDGSFTLRRREFTPEETRFRSEDPLGTNVGNENLYPYVRNNPANLVDPSGLEPEGATCSACSALDSNTSTFNVDVYEPASLSLEEAIVKALGPVHGPKFLLYQGTAAAQKVVDLYLSGWKFSVGGKGANYAPYSIDPQAPRIQVFTGTVIVGGRSDCINSQSGNFDEPEIYANLAKAINDPQALPHYRGGPIESSAEAFLYSMICSPFTRVSMGGLEVAGGYSTAAAGVGLLVTSGGLAAPILLIGIGVYSVIRGGDSIAGGMTEAVTGQPIRDLSHQALDYWVTGDEKTTDWTIFALDAATIVITFAAGSRQLFKKSKTKARVRKNTKKPNPHGDSTAGGEFLDGNPNFSVDPGWSRTPLTLQDQLTLEAARNGAGRKILSDLGDPKFSGWEKWEYKTKSASGQDSVVHFVRDPKTGVRMDFKFKKHSCD